MTGLAGAKDDGTLSCPTCKASSPLGDWLEKGSVSWPNQGWVLADCPVCSAPTHMRIDGNGTATGILDGGPAPVFIPYDVTHVPEEDWSHNPDAIVVTWAGVTFRYPAKS